MSATGPAVTVEPSDPFYDPKVGRRVIPYTVTRDGELVGFVTDTSPVCHCHTCQTVRYIAIVPTDGTLVDTRDIAHLPTFPAAVNAVLAQSTRRPDDEATPPPAFRPRHTVTVDRRYTLTIVGSIDAFVTMADDLTPGGLDSLDAGDATGAFLDLADAGKADVTQPAGFPVSFTQHNAHGDVTVTVDYDDALYRWSPDTDV